ncbi:hypothetical protein ACOMHN_007470 [Nucella lapillus]
MAVLKLPVACIDESVDETMGRAWSEAGSRIGSSYRNYNSEEFAEALRMVLQEKWTVPYAVQMTGVPRSTFYRTIKAIKPFMFGRPRARLQYSTQQMARAIADVEEGKPVRLAARENGIPLRSLYHRLKMRSSKKGPDKQQQQSSSASDAVYTDEDLQLTVQINEQSQ